MQEIILEKSKKFLEKLKENKWDLLSVLPIFLILTVIPLIVFLKVVPLEGARFEYWIGEKKNWDFFSYYKSYWFQILVSLGFIFFVLKRYLKEDFMLKKSFYYYPAIGYIITIFISTIFSKYKTVSFFGFVDRYEGMVVLLGYVFLFILAINISENKYVLNFLFGGLIISAVIISVIGIGQFIDHDFFKTTFGKLLILPEHLHHLSTKLEFRFGKNISYSTLYNPNYVGSYMALLFPLTLSFFILTTKKNIKITLGLINLVIFGGWLASDSRAGYVGVGISILFLIVLLTKKIWKNIIPILIQGVGYIVVFSILMIFSEGELGKEFYSLIFEAKSVTGEEERIGTLRDIDINDSQNELTLVNKEKEKLKIQLKNNSINFLDFNDEKIDLIKKGDKIYFDHETYENYSLAQLNSQTFRVNYKNTVLNLYFGKDGKIKIYNSRGKLKEIEDIEYLKAADGKEKVFSQRFYIWSRSIPLLKNTILWGYGPDTYAIKFPQNDYFGKLIAFGTVGKIVDKPHNLYLQMAINTGVLSLIMFLIIVFKVIYDNLKKYITYEDYNYYDILRISSFFGVLGYLVSGLANDSVVSVAPVFWFLLGISIIKIKQNGNIESENIKK